MWKCQIFDETLKGKNCQLSKLTQQNQTVPGICSLESRRMESWFVSNPPTATGSFYFITADKSTEECPFVFQQQPVYPGYF